MIFIYFKFIFGFFSLASQTRMCWLQCVLRVCSQGPSARHGDSYSRCLPESQTYVISLVNKCKPTFFSACRLIFSVFCCFFPADDLSSQDQFEVPEAGGWDATLNGEDEDDFFDLQIVKHYDGEVMVERKCMFFGNCLSLMGTV